MLFSDLETAKDLERTEAMANRSFVEARAAQQPDSGACWIDVGGAYAMFDGVESPITQTFGLGLFSDPDDEAFETLEQFFAERGAPTHHEVSPLAGAGLFAALHDRGYRPIELTSILYRDLADAALPKNDSNGLTTRIADRSEADLWARTSARGWATEAEGLEDFMRGFGKVSATCAGGFPYLAEIGGEPVAAAMLFIFDDVAILAGASTVPESRQRGAQLALLGARLKFAAERGCRIATMGALPGSQSQRNAEKNGFRIAYTRTKWMK